MAGSRLDRLYAQLLADHPYGWALFKKATTYDIQPGNCGYFDTEGDWHTIVDLTSNPEDLVRDGWKAPGTRIGDNGATPDQMEWGPKYSNSVTSRRIGGSVGSSLAVAPVEVSATVLFEGGSSESAVLVAENPVYRRRVGDENMAMQWMKDNTREMLRQHRETIKTHGIWIVTKTYATRRCAVAIMTSRTSSVELGLTANAQGLLTLGPTNLWFKSNGSSCVEIHQGRDDEEAIVVFMSGIYFSQKLIGSTLKPLRDPKKQASALFRGGREKQSSSEYSANGDGVEEENIVIRAEFFPPQPRTDC